MKLSFINFKKLHKFEIKDLKIPILLYISRFSSSQRLPVNFFEADWEGCRIMIPLKGFSQG